MPVPLDRLVAALIEEAQGENSAAAFDAIEAVVREYGPQLTDEDLYTLARLTGTDGAARAHAAVRHALRVRGLWRPFHRREMARLAFSTARWVAGLLALSVGLIFAVFFLVIAVTHILRWMGF